jgi:ABC-type Fe3+ transport system permease subunit
VLVLPLAMPGYVFTLFALGLDVPGIRSTGGAVGVFTLVLYPYVYLLARSAFLSQSRTLIEAARGLGMSRARAILRVGIPLARPAILGGVALALMEALADFGTVNLLGVRTFTDAIYRVWIEAFNRDAAMQLATLLVSVTLTLLALERLARGRARHAQLAARGDLVPPARLRGLAAGRCWPRGTGRPQRRRTCRARGRRCRCGGRARRPTRPPRVGRPRGGSRRTPACRRGRSPPRSGRAARA